MVSNLADCLHSFHSTGWPSQKLIGNSINWRNIGCRIKYRPANERSKNTQQRPSNKESVKKYIGGSSVLCPLLLYRSIYRVQLPIVRSRNDCCVKRTLREINYKLLFAFHSIFVVKFTIPVNGGNLWCYVAVTDALFSFFLLSAALLRLLPRCRNLNAQWRAL